MKTPAIAAVFLAALSASSLIAADAANPPDKAHFQFLPAGEVKPLGWLLEQIRADVSEGFTPVLDKLTPDYCDMATFDARNKTDLEQPKIGAMWWLGETTGN